MVKKLDDVCAFNRRVAGEIPSVESEAGGCNSCGACNARALTSERVFPPSLSEQTATATDLHDFRTGPRERW